MLKMFVEFIEVKRGKASRNIRMKSDRERRIKTYLRKLHELWLRAKAELLLSADESRKHGTRQHSYALIALQSSEAQLKFPRKFLIRSGHLSQRETVRVVIVVRYIAEFLPSLFFFTAISSGRIVGKYVSLGNGLAR